ncbi:MAG: stage II sporulation protein M, partial [Planctomycetaceae bacterium]|nr:stage II sporulation protein M [Planctomycetaceae bacterium]
FATAPRQLRSDPAPRLAAAVFWGAFLICALVSAARPEFAPKVVGEDFVEAMDAMYAEPIDVLHKDKEKASGFRRSDTMMAGFYIEHNTTIGLQCFAWGLFFGLGSLYELLSNGLILGTVFGHMAVSPNARNFFTFVTAHGPFELTAIVFAGAAGLRLGSGLIDTRGQTRLASLRREARCALPIVGASVVLFILAALLEGFVSASSLPYGAKAGIALACAALLVAYLALGGRRTSSDV